MTYLGEFKVNWRTMVSATVGMGFGYILYLYLQSLFAPHLLREFGWSKSQFALITSTTLISLITLPIYGRLTDRYGAKRIGAIGILSYPLIFLAFAFFRGEKHDGREVEREELLGQVVEVIAGLEFAFNQVPLVDGDHRGLVLFDQFEREALLNLREFFAGIEQQNTHICAGNR